MAAFQKCLHTVTVMLSQMPICFLFHTPSLRPGVALQNGIKEKALSNEFIVILSFFLVAVAFKVATRSWQVLLAVAAGFVTWWVVASWNGLIIWPLLLAFGLVCHALHARMKNKKQDPPDS